MSLCFDGCEIIQNRCDPAVHRAAWVIVTPWNILANGYVRVENGRIVEVGSNYSGTDAVDHGAGVLMPGLINAHTHLELSALGGRLTFDKGFKPWVADLIAARGKLETHALRDSARQGIAQMLATGTLGAGEISTLGITRDLVADSGLSGVWFQERLGPDDPAFAFDFGADPGNGLGFSVAGHAPHTTAPQLLARLKRAAALRNLPFSIHVAESSDESRFIRTATGEWADFLTERGIDYSAWPLPARSPVAYLDRLNLLDSKTLAVHLLDVDNTDLDLLARQGVKTAVCPRSNHNLHGSLPCIRRLLDHGLTPALGTDSLASCDSLGMADEMAFVAQKYPDLSAGEILAMATCYGAGALGLDKTLGSLEPGRWAKFLFVPAVADTPEHLLETITRNE